MGGPLAQKGASLQRLKSLDAGPDFRSQLEDARQLCNHGARAEMVLKWLLEKLKKFVEARLEPRSWHLLHQASRLVMPEKLALQLASSDILRMIQITISISTSEISQDLLLSIASFCNCLRDISEGPSGAPVRALLINDAEKAASVLGSWLGTLDRIIPEANAARQDFLQLCIDKELLTPALDMWASRKPHADEDLFFSHECLVSAASLLGALTASNRMDIRKRKRAGTAKYSSRTLQNALEALLARHIFLPARAAFTNSSKADRENKGRQATRAQLDDLLKPLQRCETANVLTPILCGIAVRCVPAMSLRQRFQERPWIEALLRGLRRASGVAGTSHELSAFKEMLVLVEDHRFNLPKEMLVEISNEAVQLSPDLGLQLALIATTIRLDGSIFTDEKQAENLFRHVSTAFHRLHPHKAETASLQQICVSEILVPVMQGFVSQRNLTTFVRLWHDRLNAELASDIVANLWTQLQSSFSPLLRTTASDTETESLLSYYAQELEEASKVQAPNVSSAPEKCRSTMVILAALVGGLQRDKLSKVLIDRLERILDATLHLFDASHADQSRLARLPCVWVLLTTTFNVWFPAWAIQQTELEVVGQRLFDKFGSDEYLRRSAVRAAMHVSSAVQDTTSSNKALGPIESANEAGEFIMTIIKKSYRYKYKDIHECCRAYCEDLRQHSPLLLKFADVLPPMNLQSEVIAWTQQIEARKGSHHDAEECMSALVDSCSNMGAEGQSEVLSAVIAKLEDADEQEATCLLKALSTKTATSLSLAVRRTLIDVLTEMHATPSSALDDERLSLCSRYVKHSSIGLKIASDAPAFWKLADPSFDLGRLSKGKHKPQARELSSRSLELLREIYSDVIRHIINTADREKSRTMIIEIGEAARHYCKFLGKIDDGFSYSGLLCVIGILVEQLGKRNIKQDHLDPAITSSYTTMMLRLIRVTSAAKESVGSVRLLSWSMKSLLQISKQTLELAEVDIDEYRAKLGQTVHEFSELASNRAGSESTIIMARCFQLICKWRLDGPKIDLVGLGVTVLETGLSPDIYAQVLQSFRDALTNDIDGVAKLEMVNRLLSNSASGSASSFALLRTVLAASTRDELDQASDSSGPAIFQQVLAITVTTNNLAAQRQGCDCVLTILKEKPYMTNQFTIEQTVATLHNLAQRHAGGSVLFIDVCRICTTLLQQHRSRLQDRMHLVAKLLQTLLSRLFSRPLYSNEERAQPLTARHAGNLSRVVQLLCNPPTPRKQVGASELVDQARRAQAHVGRFMHYVLHHYCTEILSGRLGEGVRDALMPGLWAILEAMEVADVDAVKILSSAMNNSERAVLRSVYDTYKTFGKSKAS